MKKLSRKSLILEHYVQTAELVIDGVTVKLWKPKTMGKLPAWDMQTLMRNRAKSYYETCWSTSNYDAWLYDAELAIHEDHKRNVTDIYICSLLIRPYSDEAGNYSEERMGLKPMDRLLLMWDSRQFDKEGGYAVSPHGDINCSGSPYTYEDYFRVINAENDIEDSSC